jgi:hypothetical protein
MASGDFLNGVGGGVKDHYGEDSATEDQLITPWNFSVARFILISHHITFCGFHVKFNVLEYY